MDSQRPDEFTAVYNGRQIRFARYTASTDDSGYIFECPNGKHGGMIHIDTDSGLFHSLTIDENGLPTVGGSILCKVPLQHGGTCGWHVFLEKGVIRDA